MPIHRLEDEIEAVKPARTEADVYVPNVQTPVPPEERARRTKTLGISKLRHIPGTYASEMYRKELLQQPWQANLVDGFLTSSLYSVAKKWKDEGPMGPFGGRREGTPYNKDEARRNMPDHYNRHQIENLLMEPTLESFMRAKARLDTELAVAQRLAGQFAGGGVPALIGQMLDVDMVVLTPIAGMAFKAAGVARASYRAARSAGLNASLSGIVSGAASGFNMGAQAGALVAVGHLTQRESATWQDAAFMFLGATVFGSVLGGVSRVNVELIDMHKLATDEFRKRYIQDDQNMDGNIDVKTMHREQDAVPGGVFEGQTEKALDVDMEGNVVVLDSAADLAGQVEVQRAHNTLKGMDEALEAAETNAKAAVHGQKGKTKAKLVEARKNQKIAKLLVDAAEEKHGKLPVEEKTDARTAAEEKGGTVVGGRKTGGLGADVVGDASIGRPGREIIDPEGPLGDAVIRFLDFADAWRFGSGFLEQKAKDAQDVWVKIMTSKIGAFGMQTINEMYKSKAASMNWFGGVVLESSNGLNRGTVTASVNMEMFHRRIQSHIGQEIDPLMWSWAQKTSHTWGETGHGISAEGYRAWSRELSLEMNERLMGRKSNPGREIKEAADRYDASSAVSTEIGKGRKGQRSIDGAENWEARTGWTPYVWNGYEIARLEALGVKRSEIIFAIVEGYRSAGIAVGKDADLIAKAVVHRALSKHEGVDSSIQSLFTGDGRAFMEESLRLNNVSERRIKGIMKKLVGDLEERSQPGFVKHRNNIDMNIIIKNEKGLDLRIVDLLNQDMAHTWQIYSRQLSGAAALARVGITNKAQRTVIINAIRAEQRSLGETPIDADKLHAMFSHFNGGPIWGFANGVTNHGISPMVAISKRIANLGLLEKLGLTQLGETGAMIAQMGVRTWYQRGVMVLWDKKLRADSDALRKEVAYIIGDIGRDERYYAEWKMLDEISIADRGEYMAKANKFSGNAAFIQAYTSGFNIVRKHQQRIAVMGMIDKVFRTIRDGDLEEMLRRFETDLGLDRTHLDAFQRMIDDGTIEFDPTHGYVNKLNMDQWDQDLAEVFGASMTRNMNQVVQKSMAGEQDAWMHTDWGSLMTHLKTFPIQAFQKQFLRNGRHMDMQSVTSMMFGLGTAMIAINIRDALDGRERSMQDRAAAAFGYNNMTSWVATAWDPAMTVLGLDSARINPYGPHASLLPPTLGQLDKLIRIPGAIPKYLTGNADYFDEEAVKAFPFAGTYVFSRLFDRSKPIGTKAPKPDAPDTMSLKVEDVFN